MNISVDEIMAEFVNDAKKAEPVQDIPIPAPTPEKVESLDELTSKWNAQKTPPKKMDRHTMLEDMEKPFMKKEDVETYVVRGLLPDVYYGWVLNEVFKMPMNLAVDHSEEVGRNAIPVYHTYEEKMFGRVHFLSRLKATLESEKRDDQMYKDVCQMLHNKRGELTRVQRWADTQESLISRKAGEDAVRKSTRRRKGK